MNLLTGEYNNTIDEKGRVSFPVKLRTAVNQNVVMVTKGLDRCLWLFTTDEWEAFQTKLNELCESLSYPAKSGEDGCCQFSQGISDGSLAKGESPKIRLRESIPPLGFSFFILPPSTHLPFASEILQLVCDKYEVPSTIISSTRGAIYAFLCFPVIV